MEPVPGGIESNDGEDADCTGCQGAQGEPIERIPGEPAQVAFASPEKAPGDSSEDDGKGDLVEAKEHLHYALHIGHVKHFLLVVEGNGNAVLDDGDIEIAGVVHEIVADLAG